MLERTVPHPVADLAVPGAGLIPLPRAFFARPTIQVARALLGKVLVRRIGAGPSASALRLARIVEVEAYLGERDAASHARRGPTPRAAIMFGPPGYLYVYLIYGMHHCMNFVTEREGQAGAVLIRAAEPLATAPGAPEARSLSGPGKLCSGLGITLADKGLDLTAGGGLFVAEDGGRAPRRAASPRIGVDYAGPWAARKLRFYIPGNPHVSGRPRD
ncbi:MAG TPA: DNA-3-methyladenine glycosylase [Polyangia bacterium]|nr:DNA-3-methyladenine glycosylase [Polyangia bacterium]